jgi:YfiH family protein
MRSIAGGVVAVPCDGALAFFSDASDCPPGLDEEELAERASEHIAHEIGCAVPVLYALQAHGRLTFTYGHHGVLAPAPHRVGTCDALITAEPDVALLVRTADCLPVALAGAGVVAMVHAGWRGLAADVLEATVKRVSIEFGLPAEAITAVVGPGVGSCHFRVGGEVTAALERHRVDGAPWRSGAAVDLIAWASGRLRALGLPAAAIRVVPGCTACDRRYHSVRRDGARAGRQWNAVLRRASTGESKAE